LKGLGAASDSDASGGALLERSQGTRDEEM